MTSDSSAIFNKSLSICSKIINNLQKSTYSIIHDLNICGMLKSRYEGK